MKMIEPLESRQLLSVSLSNGTLLLKGNNQANMFSVTYSAFFNQFIVSEITFGSIPVAKQFSKNAVKKIRVLGGGGDDVVGITATGKPSIFFDGGAGNDTITAEGTTGRHVILGGSGDDVLNGGAGNDSIDGGAGNDRLFGKLGNDTITGGTGIDLIEGDVGNDTIFAKDNAADSVKGAAGSDKARVDPVEALLSDVEKVL